MQLPDAPWIREAELYGEPGGDEIICPVCGKDAENFFLDDSNNVVGCDRCVREVDAYSWHMDHLEDERDE